MSWVADWWHPARGHSETPCPVPVKLFPVPEMRFPELGMRFQVLAMRCLARPGSESSRMGCYRPAVKPIRTGCLAPNLAPAPDPDVLWDNTHVAPSNNTQRMVALAFINYLL